MADISKIESIVLTNLQYGMPSIVTAYPTINFTSEPSSKEPTFPCVYVQELEGYEVGNGLANDTINGVMTTMQITITTNKTKADCKKIAYACADVLKGLRFGLTSTPIYSKQADVHTYIFRARRNVCKGDNL